MSNFIYYEHIEDYEEQVRKAKLCDEKDKEIERLTNELDREKSKVKEYGTRLLKATEYIHNNYPVCAGKELLSILQGEDKK